MVKERKVETFVNIARVRRQTRLSLHRLKVLLLAGILAVSLQLARGSETLTLIGRPNPDSGPTEISTEIWVVDINSIDSAQQNFIADVAVVLRWKDSRLAHQWWSCTLRARPNLASAGRHRERNQLRQSQAAGVS